MINGKTRLLYLLRLLYERTDEEHPLTTNEIEAFFADHNTVVDRKTIKNDVNTLTECGFDIVITCSSQNSYFIADRPLELAELKLLIDAVESSKFITAKKSIQLVKKLTALASVHQASELERHLYIADRVKPTNEKIYYFVDRAHTAINQQKQISFRYFEYDVKREKCTATMESGINLALMDSHGMKIITMRLGTARNMARS